MPYPLSYDLENYGGLLATRIEVTDDPGEWSVRVIEDNEERAYSFGLEVAALAFAEAHRRRLALAAIVRV